MFKKLVCIYFVSVAVCSELDMYTVSSGYEGTWQEPYECPKDKAVCGFGMQIEPTPDNFLIDTAAATGLKIKCCGATETSPWTEQNMLNVQTGQRGSWYYTTCPEGTYASAADGK